MKPKPLEILGHLNDRSGRRFRLTPKHRTVINARISEGYTLDDFIDVIDNVCFKWENDPVMAQYIRPITIFGTKMDGYLNSPKVGEIQEQREKSPAEKKRAVGDKWLKKSKELDNGKGTIPKRTKGILGIRGSESR